MAGGDGITIVPFPPPCVVSSGGAVGAGDTVVSMTGLWVVVEVSGDVVADVGWSPDLLLPHAASTEATATPQVNPYNNRWNIR
jgi:hypothetical protein